MSYANPYPGPPPFPGPPPRRSRTGLVVGLVVGGVVVAVAAVVAAVVLFGLGGADDPADLPAPRTLGKDPVPAERLITRTPATCGVGHATARALAPGSKAYRQGDGCLWSAYRKNGEERRLLVGFDIPGTTSALTSSASPVAEALRTFSVFGPGRGYRPLTGLGDEAAYKVDEPATGHGHEVSIAFRASNVVAQVAYEDTGDATPVPALRHAALRAATEVARRLGVTHTPAKAPATTTAPATVTGTGCDLVPADLSERLLGDDHPAMSHGYIDPNIDRRAVPGARTDSCNQNSVNPSLQVAVTTTENRAARPYAAREYLRAYYAARAARPVKAGGKRYFQALAGLGDEAFCSYIEGKTKYGQGGALVVVRSGTALITASYGASPIGGHPLSQEQSVNGVYALAVQAARHVH